MNKIVMAVGALLASLALTPVAHAQQIEIPLYETGPAEDAAFIRFINGTAGTLEIQAGGDKNTLTLSADKPASDFMPVRANRELKGEIQQGKAAVPVQVSVKAGEFATIIALPDGASGLAAHTLREAPDDFNALKASVAFYNLAPACANASLKAAGRTAMIFRDVPAATTPERRQINPVALDVQLVCGGQDSGAPLSLGTLQAGERYSIFLVPSAQGVRIFQAMDTMTF